MPGVRDARLKASMFKNPKRGSVNSFSLSLGSAELPVAKVTSSFSSAPRADRFNSQL